MKTLTPSTPWRDGGYRTSVGCHAQLYPDEIAYLHWAGEHAIGHGGAIIDLGAFLGGSSLALAQGSQMGGPSWPRIHAYDGFRVSQAQRDNNLVAGDVGDSYLDQYRTNLHAHLDRVTTHEGMIPEWASTPEELARIYPDAGPVSVLFIDCAKVWGVHHSILRAFGSHLSDGSLVIQQDFLCIDFYLALHMYQLRHRLTPSHSPDGSTIGFVASGPLDQTDLDALWTPDAIDPSARLGVIEEVACWLDNHAPERISHSTWLAAASTVQWFGSDGFIEACIENAQRRIGEHLSGADSHADRARLAIVRENWNCEVRRAADRLRLNDQAALADRLLGSLLLECAAGQQAEALETTSKFQSTWRLVEDDCLREGVRRVALFGAGRHTARLLAHAWPSDPRVEIVAIIDENPGKSAHAIASIPIVHPDQADGLGIECVLPSSDAHETEIWDSCVRIASRIGATTRRVYSGPISD